jgi:protein AFG1
MRNHFHDFMLNLHHRSHLFKQKEPLGDAIPAVAMEVAQEARVLCLDEFQVTNIADAMLLKRMFHVLFDLGVILITTSNRAPESLYEHGLNRGLFLPFIDELKEQCVVFNMDSSRDYRQDARELKKFYYINTSLEAAYDSFTKGTVSAETVLPVMMGRSLTVSRATETCAWFTFGELCRTALGAPDFIALATRFSHVFLVDVPQLTCHEETRRFITLVDALYEHRVKLHISASCSLEDLFVVFQKQSAGQSNTDAATYNHVNVSTETTVVSEGGSSSSNATTMFLQDEKPVEWSSTGLIDASMAQLTPATNNETSFMQTRAASRIAEMTSASWHEQQ